MSWKNHKYIFLFFVLVLSSFALASNELNVGFNDVTLPRVNMIYPDEKLSFDISQNGVFAYLNETSITSCSVVDTWYPIGGVFINSPIKQWYVNVSIPAIVYSGQQRYFQVDGFASVSSSINGNTIHVSVKHNGIVEEQGSTGTYIKYGGEAITLGGEGVFLIAPGDTIQLVVKCDKVSDLSFMHFTTTIKPFYETSIVENSTIYVNGSGKAGDHIYLYNSSTTMYLNETKLNETIDDRSVTDGLWWNNSGVTTTNQTVSMNGYNLTNAKEIQTERLRFIDNHNKSYIKSGGDSDFIDTEHSLVFGNNDDDLSEGAITSLFYAQENKTLMWHQFGKNNSFGGWGNSFGLIPNSMGLNNFSNGGKVNMTALSNYITLCNTFGVDCKYNADTGGRARLSPTGIWIPGGPLLWTMGDLEVWGSAKIHEGVEIEKDFVYLGDGIGDFDVYNEPLHIMEERIEEVTTGVGDITIFDFDWDITPTGTNPPPPFIRLDTLSVTPRLWSVRDAGTFCNSNPCARARGGDGGSPKIIEYNFTTINNSALELSFWYGSDNMDTGNADAFWVTVNNNVGSGEVVLFNDTTTSGDINPAIFKNFSLPSSMENQSIVSLRLYHQATNNVEESFVDGIKVNGTAGYPIIQNVTVQDGTLEFGDGSCKIKVNGFDNSMTFGGVGCGEMIFEGNTTFNSIIVTNETVNGSQTVIGNLNVTGNITGGETICDGNGDCIGDVIITNSTSWNRSGNDVYLANNSNHVGIGSNLPKYRLDVDGNASLGLGEDEITNGDFATGDTSWGITGGGTITWQVGGYEQVNVPSSSSHIYQNSVVSPDVNYIVTFKARTVSGSTTLRPHSYNAVSGQWGSVTLTSSWQDFTLKHTPTDASTAWFGFGLAALGVFEIDDIVVKEAENIYASDEGKVGIGTIPSYKFHLKSGGTATIPFGVTASDGSILYYIYEDGSGHGSMRLMNAPGLSKVVFDSNGNSYINSLGNFGIGIHTPGLRLEVEDNSIATAILRLDNSGGQCDATPTSGSLGWVCTSDERVKPYIQEVDTSNIMEELKARSVCLRQYKILETVENKYQTPYNITEEITEVRYNESINETNNEIIQVPYNYTYKETKIEYKEHTNYSNKVSDNWKVGYSAQCLQRIAPELVHNQFNFTGYMWNSTTNTSYYVTNQTLLSVEQPDVNELLVASAELYKRNKELKDELETIRTAGTNLKQRVDRIEAFACSVNNPPTWC